MRKNKGQAVDLLYATREETNKKSKNSPKKTNRRKKNNSKNSSNNTRINLDNEIIIGLTPKNADNENKKRRKKKTNNKKKTTEDRKNQNQKRPKKSITKTRKKQKKSKNYKRNLKIIKWFCLIVVFHVAVILFLLSSIFNIKQIIVTNNSKISSEEIINLSTLENGVNMFKTTNKTIRNGIKTNPYIEDVNIKRNINGVVTLDIIERVPTYMLKFANAYVYINNQGYMLEISETPLELPIITGFETASESIEAGNRLIVEDLKKLEDIIKIMESAKSNSLANIITEIDISDSTNYKLTIASEGKTVQFGDATNIKIKLLKIESLIEQEKGVKGDIYFQDLDRTIFREEVKR